MSTEVWITICVTPPDDPRAAALTSLSCFTEDDWRRAPGDDLVFDGTTLSCGWASTVQLVGISHEVNRFLRDNKLAARVELEYRSIEGDGVEIEYWGFNAHLLEIPDQERVIAIAQARLAELRALPVQE